MRPEIPGGAREEPKEWSRNSERRKISPQHFFKIRFGLIFEI
jgi:hypothetical protein